MKCLLLASLLSITTTVMSAFVAEGTDTEYLRPQAHFTPKKGWMNDPNGLFYDKTEQLYHLYFQFNPNNTIWGLPLYWGHATSKDLVHWDEHEAAIGPDNDDEGIFSGSIVVDENNTSGLFDDSIDPHQRVVAFYTLYDTERKQSQEMAYSLDGGYTFTKYSKNPIIDVNSKDFRDPKVFWHEPTSTWIMVTVMSKDYEVVFYGSKNLIDWEKLSAFSSGVFGNQYECPGLMHVPIEGTDEKRWVLILAINPGSPLGGSINQYFVGEFNGTHFVADDTQTRFMDIGRDFYAPQEFSGLPVEDGVLAIGWATNWQYANRAPTFPWRSSMTMVRNYTLRHAHVNLDTKQLTLCQVPVIRDLSVKHERSFRNTTLQHNQTICANFTDLSDKSTGLFDFDLLFNILNPKLDSRNESTFEIVISSQKSKSGSSDTLTLGFDATLSSFYVDRSNLSSPFMANPFFTGKLSVYIEPVNGTYHIYGLIDRNIMELYFNNGSTAMTNTFFFGEGLYPHDMHVHTHAKESFINIQSMLFRELSS